MTPRTEGPGTCFLTQYKVKQELGNEGQNGCLLIFWVGKKTMRPNIIQGPGKPSLVHYHSSEEAPDAEADGNTMV